jgi:hypothetical protein
MPPLLWPFPADIALPVVQHGSPVVLAAAGAGLLAVILLVSFLLMRRGKPALENPEDKLVERLGEYPPPPPVGRRTLTVQSEPVRLRLVVVAPLGRAGLPDDGQPEALLNKVVRGLGEVIRQDKPRVRVWPAQLSHRGFTTTFFRVAKVPQPPSKPTRWQLVGGTARIGTQQFLVGLAVLADEAVERSPIMLEAVQWAQAVRVES